MGSCASSTEFFDVWAQIAANDIDAVLRAALEASVPPGPPLHSEYKQSYRGSEPRADCVEHALRSLIDRLAWCPETGSLDPARLPPTTLASVRGFYEQGGGEGDDAAQALRWFGVCADLPADVEYLQANEWCTRPLANSPHRGAFHAGACCVAVGGTSLRRPRRICRPRRRRCSGSLWRSCCAAGLSRRS